MKARERGGCVGKRESSVLGRLRSSITAYPGLERRDLVSETNKKTREEALTTTTSTS